MPMLPGPSSPLAQEPPDQCHPRQVAFVCVCMYADNDHISFGPQSVGGRAMHAVATKTCLSSRLGSSLAHLV